MYCEIRFGRYSTIRSRKARDDSMAANLIEKKKIHLTWFCGWDEGLPQEEWPPKASYTVHFKTHSICCNSTHKQFLSEKKVYLSKFCLNLIFIRTSASIMYISNKCSLSHIWVYICKKRNRQAYFRITSVYVITPRCSNHSSSIRILLVFRLSCSSTTVIGTNIQVMWLGLFLI